MKIIGGFMENLIDELHKDHVKFSKVLDLLAEQLEKIRIGKSADYYLMLDAVSYIENYPEFELISKEDAIFNESTEDNDLTELNDTIQQLRSEHHELRALTHKLHDYISAALEDTIIEKESFEKQLETCIQRQRGHMYAEKGMVFPLLRKIFSVEQLRQISRNFQTQSNSTNSNSESRKYSELYHRITELKDSDLQRTH